jgi:hypothetical protein
MDAGDVVDAGGDAGVGDDFVVVDVVVVGVI